MSVQDMTPTQCWALLQTGDQSDKPSALLIDVRTQAEWAFVGVPTPSADMAPLLTMEWQSFPHMQVNDRFGPVLDAQIRKMGGDETTPLCFLCRSGVRSFHAAQTMAAHGYETVINISGGFEGDPDGHGHRGNTNGWKKEGLPWRQG